MIVPVKKFKNAKRYISVIYKYTSCPTPYALRLTPHISHLTFHV